MRYLLILVFLSGCSSFITQPPAPVTERTSIQRVVPVTEATTHVQAEALARQSGDFSAVESLTFRALKAAPVQSEWDV